MTLNPQDDELLRDYLLGKLPDTDADELERRLLAEDDLFELAEAVELDLLAAVDHGTLTPAEKEEVLRRLAASPRGQERLALARSLNALALEKARENNVVSFRRPAPAFPPPAIHWIALAASLVVLAGLSWFAWHNREQAPKLPSTVAGPTPSVVQPFTPVAPSPTIAQTDTPKPTTGQRPAVTKPRKPIATAVLTLAFSNLRGSEQRQQLQIASGIQRVEIQIYVDGPEPAKAFDVLVRTHEQRTVAEKKGLALRTRSWGRGLVLSIPAAQLPEGRYEVAVTPQGGAEISQDFEVVASKR